MCVWSELQGETKILKLKNLRPQDYANYSCIASVRNVCGIPDRSVIFRLTNKTGAHPALHAARRSATVSALVLMLRQVGCKIKQQIV